MIDLTLDELIAILLKAKTEIGGDKKINVATELKSKSIVINFGYDSAAQRLFEQLKASIDTRLNDLLCDTKPNYDDSITGINDAWDVVRKACDEYIERAKQLDKKRGLPER
jgi:hypothetical protein